MIQTILDQGIATLSQSLHGSEVGEVPGTEDQRTLSTSEVSKAFLQVSVGFGIASDQRRGTRACAVTFGCGSQRFADSWVVAQSQVVVVTPDRLRAVIQQGALGTGFPAQDPLPPQLRWTRAAPVSHGEAQGAGEGFGCAVRPKRENSA